MIFKGVRDGRPYPDHGLTHRQWAQIPPRQIRLDELVTTTTVLALDRLLSEDSTFYGDLFPHAVRWKGIIYLEDGVHSAVRSALRNRVVLHARVFDMDMPYVATGLDLGSFGSHADAGRVSHSDCSATAYSSGRLTTIASWVERAITTTASLCGSGFSSRCGTYGGTKM